MTRARVSLFGTVSNSQMIPVQEFEEMLIDDEDPEDVEAELMGAHDYYEHDEGEDGLVPAEPIPINIDQSPDSMDEQSQLQHMAVIIEELFSISEVLTNEETMEYVYLFKI